MNFKKAIASGLIGFVAFVIVGAIVSQLLLVLFPNFKTGIVGQLAPMYTTITMIWMGIIECISFAIIFAMLYKSIPGEGAQKGLIFGLILWYVNIFISFLGCYAFTLITSVPDLVFVNVLKFFMLPAYGATLGWAYRKLKI